MIRTSQISSAGKLARIGVLAALCSASFAALADASVILSGYGGPASYGSQVMSPNDDSSSSLLNLPFAVNFYGNTFNNFFVNNNGNITFNAPVGTYTPDPFPIASQPMIAPYWADVDTRCQGCGAVYVASPNADTVVVTWDRVGYYSANNNKTNTFQLVLRNQNAGNFDVEFRYGQLQWTTGDASGGSNGLGGVPAQAGMDAGNGADFFTLPGSRTSAALDWAATSNVSPAVPGLWSFAVRTGQAPGSTPDNPAMPVLQDGSWFFSFNIGPNTNGGIGLGNSPIFIDPVVAVGYDYIVSSGPNFQSVLLPANIGDGIYDLWTWNIALGVFEDSGIDLVGGVAYDFGVGGVSRFSVRGIEASSGLDPNNTSAFVTGLTFTQAGQVDMTMTPVTFDTGDNDVPLPGTLLLVASALGLLRTTSGARTARRRGGAACLAH